MSHAIIIGGTKGVGRELAHLWAQQGDTVTVVGRTPVTIPTTQGQIVSLVGDAEQPAELLTVIQKQIAEHGPLTRLVFLQRYRGNGDNWAGEIAVAMTATKILIEGLAESFRTTGDRSICLVTSSAARLVARNQSLAYHTSKAAMTQMARYYAVKLGPRGIRVNVVAPCTFVKEESSAYYSQQTDLLAMYATITPLGRIGTAREVAQAIALLGSPEASFITGQELAVDGGLSLMLQDALAKEVARI